MSHLHVLSDLEECEGHAANNHHLIHAVQHVLDELDLILDLGSTQDGKEGPVGSNLETVSRYSTNLSYLVLVMQVKKNEFYHTYVTVLNCLEQV